jgi:hypothetical protein
LNKKCWIALADGLCDLGAKSLQLKASMIGKAGHAAFNYTLAFAFQLRKTMENLCQKSRVVGDNSLRGLGRLLGTASAGLLTISEHRLPVGDFSQPLEGTRAFQVAELRDPHQL